jgi:hypothetical protein
MCRPLLSRLDTSEDDAVRQSAWEEVNGVSQLRDDVGVAAVVPGFELDPGGGRLCGGFAFGVCLERVLDHLTDLALPVAGPLRRLHQVQHVLLICFPLWG